MHPEIRVRQQRIRECCAQIKADIEFLRAFDEALGLAFCERTGEPLVPGGRYSKEDARRAESIVPLLLAEEKSDEP